MIEPFNPWKDRVRSSRPRSDGSIFQIRRATGPWHTRTSAARAVISRSFPSGKFSMRGYHRRNSNSHRPAASAYSALLGTRVQYRQDKQNRLGYEFSLWHPRDRGPQQPATDATRPGRPIHAGRARIRVRFTSLRGTLVRIPMDSRLRGNDINCILAVIPAKAGIHMAYPNTNGRERRAGAQSTANLPTTSPAPPPTTTA